MRRCRQMSSIPTRARVADVVRQEIGEEAVRRGWRITFRAADAAAADTNGALHWPSGARSPRKDKAKGNRH